MSKSREVFEFFYDYINAQIDKYVKLTKIGIGPDASMNARLVMEHVEELLGSAKIAVQTNQFENMLKQMRFYLEQEYLRAYSGWLIDENRIHNPAMERIHSQRNELAELGEEKIPAATTEIQKQCEHDSHEIAFLILDLAIKLKENPEAKLDDTIPDHAQKILRRHASKDPNSRYNQTEIWGPIQSLHQQSSNFLKQSALKKSRDKLMTSDALQYADEHRKKLTDLLNKFQKNYPKSNLGNKLDPTERQSTHSPYARLFSYTGAILGVSLCAYLAKEIGKTYGFASFGL